MTTAGILASGAKRGALTASVVETAHAVDDALPGFVTYDVLVDDPASASDTYTVRTGEIMVEAANATATVSTGISYNVSTFAGASASDLVSGTGTYSAAVAEAAAADAVEDSGAPIAGAHTYTRVVVGVSGVVYLTED